MFHCGIFHFYLEGITNKLDLIQFDSFQNLAIIAHKTRGEVLYVHPSNKTYINRCKITHKHPAHWPVNHIYALYVARTYRYIGTFSTCSSEFDQIIGIVRE